MKHPLFQRVTSFTRILMVIGIWVVAVSVLHTLFTASGSFWVREWSLVLAFLGACASAWLGWGIRQAWIYPFWLRRAEAVWASGGYASEVVDLLAKIQLATGELGYRVWLLRAKANLALGFRNLAWMESEEAHLARVPFFLRPFLRSYLHAIANRSRTSLERSSSVWLWLTPRMPRLKWVLAVEYLHRDDVEDRNRAWNLLMRAVPHAAEDPLLLEEILLALLGRIEAQEMARESELELERVLHLLLHGHGYLRPGWDRVPPALYLLRRQRCAEVLALGLSLPVNLYSETLWVVTVAARKELGDLEGAWKATEQALAIQPGSFRLWMMHEDLALELHRNAEALKALEQARAMLSRKTQVPEEQLREWHTRRAEYAYWIEHDSQEASRHLDYLPLSEDVEGRLPLRLLILLDLGLYDDVQREVVPLLASRPENVDLQMIQAESFAGMQAWDALRDYLASLGEPAQRRSEFWHLRGICRSNMGDLLHAREDLERSAQMQPDNLRMVLDAGHASSELGDWERAEYLWRQVLRRDECNEEALTQLAEARRIAHDLEGAKRFLRECLLHHPESQSAQVMLAELDSN